MSGPATSPLARQAPLQRASPRAAKSNHRGVIMKDCAKCKNLFTANRILLGLLMLVPGLLKLFVVKPAAVVGMLTGMGYPIPSVLAWVLIIAEITTGVMILGGWNLRYAIIPPAIILTLAGFTAY
ncbi:hypothetical protein COV94_02085, partial [Candidatus Woesearchaeota archaeon CG11_big_fil_rev_8_21_14_0_20_57_5]